MSAAILKKAASPTLGACAHVFLTQLYLKNADRDSPEHYSPMRSKITRGIVTTRYYGQMMALLDSLDAIERFKGGGYLTGKVSIRYRIASRYAFRVRSIDLDFPRLEARWEKQMSRASYAAMSGRARKWIVASYKTASFAPELETLLATHRFKTEDAATCTRHHVENILAHRPRFFVCPRSGRIYYSVANLPKALRAQIMLSGEPAVEIDISASQPTLLATLYPKACEEKANYLNLIRNEDIYTTIATWAGEGWDRARAKTEFFNQIAFGSYYNSEKYDLLPVFRKHFPQLTRLMDNIKLGGNELLPLRMQKIEADITIYGACDECATRKIPVLPVHDSLLCRLRDAPTVKEIFARHWLSQTGIPAQLKV